jgi:hypothetical protein
VARGLALQVLGHLSNLIRKQDDVHFRVLDRLSSTNQFESESALFCISQVAATSEPFAAAVLRLAPALLADENGGSRFKIGLVGVLGEMNHTSLCGLARKHIKTFLSGHAQEDFVVASLKALTRISDMFSEEHVEFLWEHFLSDPRPRVRLTCLRGLFALACRAPHHGDHRPSVILAVLSTPQSPVVQAALLAVFTMIAKHWSVIERLVAVDTSVIESLLNSANDKVGLWALRALTVASAVLPAAAEQLRKHVVMVLKLRHAQQKVRSPVLTACVMLCSKSVARHSPGCAPTVLSALADASAQEGASAVLHGLSIASALAGSVSLSVLGEDAWSSLAAVHSSSPFGFAAVVIAFIRSFNLLNNEGRVSDLGKLGPLLRQVEPMCVRSTEARWWWYCIGREAAICGIHEAAAEIFAHLADYVESDQCRCWLLVLSECSAAERNAQQGLVLEASAGMRRALIAIATAGGTRATQQSASTVVVQTVARNNLLSFQKRYARWRLGVFEAAASRSDLWRSLGEDSSGMSSAFPGMSAVCRSTLKGCASCCFAVSGAVVLGEEEVDAARASRWISRLRSSLSSAPSVYSIMNAFYLASSLMPRDFFTTLGAVSVELSVAKLKVPTELTELNVHNSSETGHVVTIDGVVKERLCSFRSVVLTVSVVWVSEKPSQAARSLCEEKRIGNVLSSQSFTGQIYNSSFSVQALLTFSAQPKNQHLILIRVALIETHTSKKYEDVALECVAYSALLQ